MPSTRTRGSRRGNPVSRRKPAGLTSILKALELEATGSPAEYRFGRKGELTIRMADTAETRERAAALLGKQKPAGLHDLMPSTTVFLVERDGKDVATASVAFDGALGLPADSTAKAQLDELRRAKRRPAEIYAVGTSKQLGFAAKDVLLHLFRLAHLCARNLEESTDILVATPSRHAVYSKRFAMQMMLLTVPGAGITASSAVLRLSLENAEIEYYTRYSGLPGARDLHGFMREDEAYALAWLRKHRLPLAEDDLLKLLSERRREFMSLPPEQRHAMEDLYLAYDLRDAFGD